MRQRNNIHLFLASMSQVAEPQGRKKPATLRGKPSLEQMRLRILEVGTNKKQMGPFRNANSRTGKTMRLVGVAKATPLGGWDAYRVTGSCCSCLTGLGGNQADFGPRFDRKSPA